MRLLTTASFMAALCVSSAQAQLNIKVNTNDPLTGLPPEQWIILMTTEVNARPIIGKEAVYMLNATGIEMVVNCGKWTLVGNSPYIKGNPASLPPFSVTYVDTEGFDGYCKDGVKGLSTTGSVYNGRLNSADGSFTNSTFIIFSEHSRVQ